MYLMRICTVEGCIRPLVVKEMCEMHYLRLRRTGVLSRIEYSKICKVLNCNNESYVKGYCNKHYQKNWKYGNPDYTIYERHGMSEYPEYHIWSGIINRCYNPNNKAYIKYGGRDITVCERWKNSFAAFYEDMGPKPFPRAQIDREENDGNYELSNCRWTTSQINNQNRSITKLNPQKVREIRFKHNSGKYILKDLAKEYNISCGHLCNIVNYKTWKNIK